MPQQYEFTINLQFPGQDCMSDTVINVEHHDGGRGDREATLSQPWNVTAVGIAARGKAGHSFDTVSISNPREFRTQELHQVYLPMLRIIYDNYMGTVPEIVNK